MKSLPFPFPVVRWDRDHIVLIDQTLLPDRFAWRRCRDVPSLCVAIRELAVRGAPAIGVAAGFGMALSWQLAMARTDTVGELMELLREDRDTLAGTRPTAVNLFWALERCARLAESMAATGAPAAKMGQALLAEAQAICDEDVAMCRALGAAGAQLLPDPATVLTHCNAGGLATSGYGTALGVVFAAQEAGKTVRVYADETRPLLQGARLTAWEMVNRGIDVTVICDSAAATVLSRGRIDAVITGADRIAANGDAANKIGTYPLAVMARRHGIAFYVAAPASTFDPDTQTGQGIVIEERDPAEVGEFGARNVMPEGAKAWNPAFDVTPADLITAFITEKGILKPPYDVGLDPVLKR